MSTKPRMRSRAELIAALRHARHRHAAEEAQCAAHAWGTPEHTEARVLSCIWQGEIQAYRYALRVEGGSADDPTE